MTHDPTTQLESVLDVFDRLGIEVRCERCGGGGGGMCTVQGKKMLYVDLDADRITRLERSIEALASTQGVDSLFLPPSIREMIDNVRESAEDG